MKEQLADPWGLVVGGLSGGMAGAVALAASVGAGVAIPLALGVGAVVYGVKVGLGALADRERPAAGALPMPAKGSPADVWLRRAEKSIRTLHEQTESPPDAATRSHVSDIDDQAAETLGDLRRLAAQVAAVESAAARIDIVRLRADSQRLAQAVGMASDPGLRAEHERAANSVQQQIQVFERLVVVRDQLIAKMQSTAIELEGLIARLAEVLALTATAGGIDTAAERIAGLADELDGLQIGLRETEALSRRVLALGGQVPSGG